jgi:hypothetical protein
MNDEGLLANGVSATKRGETIAGRSCFGNDGGEKNDGVKGKTEKGAESRCFSNGKNERLLVKEAKQWCFSNGGK